MHNRALKPPSIAPLSSQPSAQRKVIAVDQHDQGDKSTQRGKADHRVAVNRKAALAQGEGIKKPSQLSLHRKAVHYGNRTVGKRAKNADQCDGQNSNLHHASNLDCRQIQLDVIEIPRERLVLFGRDQLVHGPQEQEPDKTQPQQKQRGPVLHIFDRQLHRFCTLRPRAPLFQLGRTIVELTPQNIGRIS